MAKTEKSQNRFSIIRAKDLADFADCELMEQRPLTEVEAKGSVAAHEAGMLEGAELKVFFEMPGMSLTHVWFKSGFPLPRHSHDTDCLYYILAGSLRLGTETLGTGDGFFVGADVPYTYTPGENGVELLEYRSSNVFDIKLMANNPDWWTKAVAGIESSREGWDTEPKPSSTKSDAGSAKQ